MIANALKTTADGVVFLKQIPAELVGLLPIVLPVVITLMAVRKGISFLMGTLRGA